MKTTIVVHTKFTLRLEGDPVMSAHGLAGVIPFEPGEHEVEQAIADHWFVKHHADPKPPQRALNEAIAQQHAALMREQLAAVVTAAAPALATEPAQALQTHEVAVLVTADIPALHSIDLAAMVSSEAAALVTAEVPAIETADVAVLATEQVQALATADVAALATEQQAAPAGNAADAQPAAQLGGSAKTSRVQGKQGSNRPRK